MESASKMIKTSPLIGTHNGTFHCDEAFACFMLKLLPQYKDADIVRTRDEKILQTCDVVVDVGGVYDPKSHRYDHHQRGFEETMSSVVPGKTWNIKLSSAGLVYCHFGHDVLRQIVPDTLEDKDLEAIYNSVYENFVQEIDAIDNGVPMTDSEPRYKISTNISSRVSHLNAPWNEPEEDPSSLDRFSKAMKLVGDEFVEHVNYAANSWWPARSFVLKAYENRLNVHESGQIMLLEQFCPWKHHYFELMKELKVDPESINFMLFESNGMWRVQGIPKDATSFVGKIFLHPEWRGLRDEELSKLCEIEGCTFVHASGFIGGNKTRDGAIQMAVKSIEHASK